MWLAPMEARSELSILLLSWISKYALPLSFPLLEPPIVLEDTSNTKSSLYRSWVYFKPLRYATVLEAHRSKMPHFSWPLPIGVARETSSAAVVTTCLLIGTAPAIN